MADEEKDRQEKDRQLTEDSKHWTYDHNPVPWWMALLWAAALIWGIAYLVIYLL